ncbi:sensor histidine kinase [Altererythrobacter sp. MF3-039]|uniref:sensor histidine kinase n=1 Tax=Altererythrobacter sp. MF3-039 TaxID=3252901 RepID=UPI00390CCA0F
MSTGDRIQEAPVARVPIRLVLLSIVVLWACYYGLISARSLIIALPYQGEMLWRRAIVSLGGAALTFVLWWGIRFFDRNALWVKVSVAIVLALPIAFTIAGFNRAMFAPLDDKFIHEMGKKNGLEIKRNDDGELIVEIENDGLGDKGDPLPPTQVIKLGGDEERDYWRQLSEMAIGRYFLLLAWCALYFAMLAGEKARLAERREGEFRQAARAAELRSLRYQVNPHFLFNTLNSLSALILTSKNEQAEEMVQSIASFYRRSLIDDPTADLCLYEEVELQRNYLAIEAVRFPERLRTRFDIPDDLLDARLPGMILQPLVENSVKYAVAASVDPTLIEIKAREEFGRLLITVSDDGPGLGDNGNSDLNGNGQSHGIGLINVRQRLEARFGGDVQITSGPTETGYTTHIRVPLDYDGNC